jgi:hypothetical protein
LPGRQPCRRWRHPPAKPPSKRPIITEGIIGTVAIIGTDTIIGAPITIVGIDGIDGTIGIDGAVGTDGTGIIFGFHIIGSKPGRRSNLKKYCERKAAAAGLAFLSKIQLRHGFRTKRQLDHRDHREHVRDAVCSSVVNKKELYIMFLDHAPPPPGKKANGYSIFRPRNF